MKRIILAKILLLAGMLPLNTAAFIDPPTFLHQPVEENQAFTVSMRIGLCDSFPFAGFPVEVIRTPPNRVQLFVTGIHNTDPLLCTSVIRVASIELPPLPAGEYQFELYVRNRTNSIIPIHNGPVAPFTVVGANPLTAIPTLSISGMLAMILGMLGLAWFARNRLR